jgi:IS30 family transposase
MAILGSNTYASWERGLNENTNGLIRQYFPKKTQFKHISDQQVQSVMEKLNNRPGSTKNRNTKSGILQGLFICRTSEFNPRFIIYQYFM